MRTTLLHLAALCAPVVLAVPHGDDHRHHHPGRGAGRFGHTTVTDVVTVTAKSAVVWVDQYNNVISTEYQGHPTSPVQVPDVENAAVAVPTPSAAPEPTQAEPSTTTPDAPSAASTAISSAFSSFFPPADASPSPAPLTIENASDTPPAAAPTSPEISVDNTADNRVVNKGKNGGTSGAQADNNAAAGGFGVDFELIGSNGCKPQSQLNSELGFLSSQGFSKIRFYDIGCDLRVATAAAAAAGFSVTLGLNTINNVNGDLQTLIGMIKGNWGPIDTVVIGNEVVNGGGSAGASAAAVNAGRGILQAAGFTKNVVAVDTFMAHQAHPEICAASDYCAVNAHAFFDPNTQASNAGSFVKSALASIKNNGKAIIVTESGWPYQGSANGAAIPSPANQQAAIASLKQAFAGNPGGLFLFQAYDATYKAPGAFGVEPYFGIFGH